MLDVNRKRRAQAEAAARHRLVRKAEANTLAILMAYKKVPVAVHETRHCVCVCVCLCVCVCVCLCVCLCVSVCLSVSHLCLSLSLLPPLSGALSASLSSSLPLPPSLWSSLSLSLSLWSSLCLSLWSSLSPPLSLELLGLVLTTLVASINVVPKPTAKVITRIRSEDMLSSLRDDAETTQQFDTVSAVTRDGPCLVLLLLLLLLLLL